MPDVHITDLASVGVWQDIPPWQLPPEAFNLGTNVRIKGDGAGRMPGWLAVWDDLVTQTPQFLLPVKATSGEIYWIYCSDTGIYAIDGATQTDLSGAAYTGTQWQSTILGGVPILNNGSEKPQFWDLNLANNFGNLTNFPGTATVKTIKAFGPYLVGVNWTIAGVRYPHMVKWSHPADPGTIPASWDETDPTKDAGQVDLPDVEAGECLDMLPMRGANIIYKENSTWLQRPTGSGLIFQHDQFLSSVGIMAARCVALTGDGKYHFVVTNDDIIVHDGVSTPVSVIDRRMRRVLFEQIDPEHYANSFVFSNAPQTEMWFCYPTIGNEFPNKALVWQYGAGGSLGVLYEAEVNWRWAATGDIGEDSDFWDNVTTTWDETTGFWNTNLRRRVLAVDGAGLKFFMLDSSSTRDGSNFTSTLAREGLAILGRRRSGEPIVDWRNRKFLCRLWPNVVGSPISVRVGSQSLPDGSVTWQSPQTFDPATDRYVDLTIVGEGLAIEFSSTAAGDWKLHGYTLELGGAKTGGGGRY